LSPRLLIGLNTIDGPEAAAWASLGERLLFPRLTQIVSDFCQNTFAGNLLGRRSIMWCVLVAEIVDKPLAVSAFPNNGIYLTGHIGILQDQGNRGILVQPTTDRSLAGVLNGYQQPRE
jgi:hypothetical protein